MKILHVSQGFPPFRVGGLTRYCIDLMQEHKKQGHDVALLYPGRFSLGRTRVNYAYSIGFSVHEIINPLPLALVFGINAPERYTKKCLSNCYSEFLFENAFDVIHVHCTMGIHRAFFEAAKAAKIRMVFTTHDYYLLCPRCTFFKDDGHICNTPGGENCRICNAGKGLSVKQELIMQSKLYQKLKYSAFVAKLRNSSRGRITAQANKPALPTSTPAQYKELLEYNRSILQLMDVIHCNSALTQNVYASYEPDLNYRTIPISHANLPHKRQSIPVDEVFRMAYLGGASASKGYPVLLEAVRQLNHLGLSNWELHLYGGVYPAVNVVDSRIQIHGSYTLHQLQRILEDVAVLVVPSVCYETFGYVVLEALAAGTPAIVSDKVGCKDLVASAPVDLVIPSGNCSALAKKLLEVSMHYEKLLLWAKCALIPGMAEHAKQIDSLYIEV